MNKSKTIIYIGAAIGGYFGSWVGSFFDHGNIFGFASIFLGAVMGIAGIYVAYKIQQ